jgi:hypothetical protein
MLEFARSLAPLAAKPPDRKISPGEQERAPAVRRDLPASAGASALACQTIGDPDRLSLPRRGSAGGDATLIEMLGGRPIGHMAVFPSSGPLMSRPSRSTA